MRSMGSTLFAEDMNHSWNKISCREKMRKCVHPQYRNFIGISTTNLYRCCSYFFQSNIEIRCFTMFCTIAFKFVFECNFLYVWDLVFYICFRAKHTLASEDEKKNGNLIYKTKKIGANLTMLTNWSRSKLAWPWHKVFEGMSPTKLDVSNAWHTIQCKFLSRQVKRWYTPYDYSSPIFRHQYIIIVSSNPQPRRLILAI